MNRLDEIKARAATVAAKPENREATFTEFSQAVRLAHFDVPALVAAVEAALAIHKRVAWDSGDCCFSCSDHLGDPIPYPCETAAAIRDALGEDEQ